ncbi:MAG: GH116 family glycosyl-hydrolase [Myxococcota bacterium]|nr:GH116 family glycosyl-hydrolase [Myxococcota bacterium]
MLNLIRSTLSAMRSPGHRVPVHFSEESQTYINTHVYRGFPMASLGSGGFSVSTSGGFENYRMHNNWMQPLHFAPGSFWAISCTNQTQSWNHILRQNVPKRHKEYRTLKPIERVTFKGELPHFTQTFTGTMPLEITVNGFSPLIPHAQKTSTLPSALFGMEFKNLSAKPLDLSFLFSWQNILGHGGIGCGGMPKNKLGIPELIPGKKYKNVKTNTQQKIQDGDLWGLCFKAGDAWGEQDYRHSSMGCHLLLANTNASWSFSQSECWDPNEPDPQMLNDFKNAGQVQDSYPHTSKSNAAALCAKRTLEPGESSNLEFQLIWWTPGHVVKPVSKNSNSKQHCTRVGHYYENHFNSAKDLAIYTQAHKATLRAESSLIAQWLKTTSLPQWLKHMLLNASDSATCNSVLPKSGVLHTIEAVDWPWPYGGLTGTADQRLISHPFTASFFSDFDRTEIHSFIKLHKNGSVSHGNGNCDFALESSDVPYGRPLDLHRGLKESHWPDLTMSIILQTYRYIKVNNDTDYLAQIWPELLKMAEHLRAISPQGVPLGGHTFDTFKIDGVFIYTAGLYLSTLGALKELAKIMNASQAESFSQQETTLLDYIETHLWEPELGYYKTSPNRPTLFLGALAGDWFRHWSGIKGGLSIEHTRAHIKRQHDVLIKHLQPRRGRAAFSYMEAFPSGRKKANWFKGVVFAFGYASQVIAYHALEAIHLGLVQEGLETIEHLYKRITRGAYLWSSDLYGNAGPIYMSHTALWALPNALSGAVLDTQSQVLKLSPQQLDAEGVQRWPLCFPNFLGHLDWAPKTNQATLSIFKHFGPPLSLKRIEFFDTIHENSDSHPWVLESGQSYKLTFDRQQS